MKIVLLRHGECFGLNEGMYNGWKDLELTDAGVNQTFDAAKHICEQDIVFDKVFCSELARAKQTASNIVFVLNKFERLKDKKILKSYLLNERHYGAFQGKIRAQLKEDPKYADVFAIWKDVNTKAPEITDEEYLELLKEYSAKLGISDFSELKKIIPKSESILDVENRVDKFFVENILPQLIENPNSNILIVSHANTLKLIAKKIENVDYEACLAYKFATCGMYIYDLDYNKERGSFKINSKTILNNNWYA